MTLSNISKIKVTRKDIKSGKRMNPFCCPIGLAFKRQIQTDGSWDIFPDFISHHVVKKQFENYSICESVSEAIKKFDATGVMSPMSLEVDMDERFVRLASR